uniref:Uncharacterized protein n=1 Tax=Arundo donax TaxID=35708 RepID=A0A0A9G2E0_ARUDO
MSLVVVIEFLGWPFFFAAISFSYLLIGCSFTSGLHCKNELE